jgi:hypothetical protein
MKKLLLVVTTLAVYALHQDVWLWSAARPLVLGFLPIGLLYHLAYCVLAALLMALLVAQAWPERLERDADAGRGERRP